MINTLENLLQECLLPKLSKSYDESQCHPEYKLRQNNLSKHFKNIIEALKSEDLSENQSSKALPLLLILYLELQCDTSLAEDPSLEDYLLQLKITFTDKNGISLEEVLKTDTFKKQEIFDSCLKYLHEKLTHNDFKKYPVLIDVYYNLLKSSEELQVIMKPTSVLPGSLILIDDYNINNKLKGLECCSSILKCLSSADFIEGNYHEVIYGSLKKNVTEKDIEVTKLVLKCLLNIIEIFPLYQKKTLLDEIFSMILDELHTDSNLYRKVECFEFTKKIISLHGINCVKKRIFKDIIYDNLNVCSEVAISVILLLPVIECLQMWIKHCWCTWKLQQDYKILSALFKLLYTSAGGVHSPRIRNLILTLILLCNKHEQSQIKEGLKTKVLAPYTGLL